MASDTVNSYKTGPDEQGRLGNYGGRFVPHFGAGNQSFDKWRFHGAQQGEWLDSIRLDSGLLHRYLHEVLCDLDK